MVNVTNYCLHSEFIELSGLEGPILHTRKIFPSTFPLEAGRPAALLLCVFIFFKQVHSIFRKLSKGEVLDSCCF